MNSPVEEKMNRRILIVDDNRAIHSDFSKILSGDNTGKNATAMETALFGEPAEGPRETVEFELASAYQGAEAFELVKQAEAAGRPYAMVFMDVWMPPGWDGIETTERL